ncbi:MAG TPA: UDP-3-O-[3-hydroxymyristoyl] N-acetylglucosamine deacetylase [Elusimicrobia bacterium]|nr:UDP-3-O-[3-hydroxymyristoyl] N-acetylglucosamine deacetylase [Elusimicrobiota bacterium]HBT61895.1 UDP-3-O-[3-hydroxymyristoyl] N-acetylglucosamine deacetylase [Elusimicrobiota bacterium]
MNASIPQTTLQGEVVLKGIGLHTGNHSQIVFRPAPANSGIRFFRTDLPGNPMIPALLDCVVTTVRGTNLGLGEARVHTVEHVLSACTGVGLDNVDIHVSANEPPILDGSARPFAEALRQSGLQSLAASKRCQSIPGEVAYEDGTARYRALPAENFEITATLIHNHPMMPRMTYAFRFDQEAYFREVAPARTFCFEHEVAFLRSQGLAQGGSLENAIVIGKDRFHTTPDGLRFADEFVRHKLLDLIGDLTLVGRPLFKMRIEAQCLGHAHNVEFAKRICAAAATLRRKTLSVEA